MLRKLKQETTYILVVLLVMPLTAHMHIQWIESISPAYADHVSPTALNLSDNAGTSETPKIAVSGSNVYVVWQDEDDANSEILFARSTDSGSSFEDPVNLSNNAGSSTTVQIAVSGNNVYVVWQDLTDVSAPEILFARSTDSGSSFEDPVNLSNADGPSRSVQIAVSGSNVYLVWSDFVGDQFDVLFARSTDSGSSFEDPVNLSNNAGNSGGLGPSIAVSGSNVYVVWQDNDSVSSGINFKKITESGSNFTGVIELLGSDAIELSQTRVAASGSDIYVVWDSFSGNEDIFFKRIIDNGETLDTSNGLINISDNTGTSSKPEIAVDGTTVYVTWHDDSLEDSIHDISLSVISDSGNMQSCPINMSDDESNSESSRTVASNGNLFLVWHDQTNDEILFASGSNLTDKSVTVNPVQDSTVKWEQEDVSLSGSIVNNEVSDDVLIDWGDGSQESVVISGCSWGPVDHMYDSSAIGSNLIQIFLRDNNDETVDDSSIPVEIEKHVTTIILDQVPSGPATDPISLTGTLTDIDSNTPIVNATITFNGTGVVGLVETITDEEGVFLASTSSIGEVGQGFTAQAIFNESGLYMGSVSDIQSFDTTASMPQRSKC